MKQFSILRASVCIALASAVSSQAVAAGFQVNEHSGNGLGRAFAGQAAKPENASILATNPAAITAFDKSMVSVSANYINPNIDIDGEVDANLGAQTATLDASEDDVADAAVIPSAFYTTPIDEKLSFGVGLFANYGLATDYSDEYNALHFADTAEVVTMTVNPALAYKLTDTLSLGFGISATYAEAEISTATPQAIGPLTGGMVPGNATILKLEGDDWGYGWNVGALWQATDATTLALSYRAETELDLAGEVESQLMPMLNQGGELALDLAAITELAVDHKLNARWSLQASAVHTQWSAFEKLEATLDDGTVLPIKREDFENTWRMSVGATYVYSDALTLRAGYAYDEGAVSFAHRSLSIPDTDRHWLTAGATYTLDDASSIDMAYGYIKGREANVRQQREIGPIVSTLTATEHANAHLLSLQYNVSF